MPGETTTPDTAVATMETTAAKNASANNWLQGQNRGNINRKNIRTLVDTEDKKYKGDTPEVSGILALCTENLTKKITFDTLQDKLDTYTNKELTHATDVVCVVKHMNDLKINFYNNNKPKNINTFPGQRRQETMPSGGMLGGVGKTSGDAGALCALARPRHRGDTGGGKPPPTTVPPVRPSGLQEDAQRAPPGDQPVQDGDGA